MDDHAAPSFTTKLAVTISRRYQTFLDKSTPFVTARWVALVVSLVLFMARIVLLQGFYIVAYALGIYLLNLFIAFLSPKIDPAMMEDEGDEDEPQLPTKQGEDFRPFIRRLPEFKFWLSAQRAVLWAFAATFFSAFDVPVFWPILVLYFIILFTVSMKRQIMHMIRFRYLPFSFGKPRHKGKEDTGKVIRQ